MRFVLAIVSLLSLLGAVLYFAATLHDPQAGAFSLFCVLLFAVSGGIASIIEHMIEQNKKVEAALKDIAASNAAMSVAIQNRSKSS